MHLDREQEQPAFMFRSAFPDVHLAIEELFAESDKVTTRLTMVSLFLQHSRRGEPTELHMVSHRNSPSAGYYY